MHTREHDEQGGGFSCCDQFASRHAVPGKVWHEAWAMAQRANELLCTEFVSKHALLYVHYTRTKPDRHTPVLSQEEGWK